MSRIDEALKRASQGSVTSRVPSRGGDGTLRLAEELTIEQYPQEARGAEPERREPRPAPPHVDDAAFKMARREVRSTPPQHVGIQSNSKLIVDPSHDNLSLEQYRRIAATLHEAQTERGLKTVMVTSALPREGKTLTVINVALTLSESYGRRVLVIDADLRRPSVHDVLRIPNGVGLNEVIRGTSGELPFVQVSPTLSVLTSGELDRNPQGALSSDRMRRLLQDSTGPFDWVLIDTPPVAHLSDAQLLSRLADGVVFVIRAESTPLPVIEKAVNEIGRESIIGVVLNGVDKAKMAGIDYYDDSYDSRSR